MMTTLQESHFGSKGAVSEALKTPRKPIRVAILLSHPVQYLSPLFRELAEQSEIDLTVIYCGLAGAETYFDREFGRRVQWDTPLLEGYRYKVLRSWSPGVVDGPFGYFSTGVLCELTSARYDALVVFGWSSLTYWLAFFKARLGSIPWMIYGDTNVLYERESRGLKALVRRTLLRTLFKRSASFLISGTMNRRFYHAYGVPEERCFDVPNAVDVGRFSSQAREARKCRSELRAGYGIPEDTILLLFSGKLVPRKRPQDLLETLAVVQKELPQVGAAFIGDGELRPLLANLIARQRLTRVWLFGFRNQSEMPTLYVLGDALVIPSYIDPKPLVTNEAMACGLPVIVSDRTGLWGPGDIVRHGENGLVYRCGDLDALTDAVRLLAHDGRLRQRMGRRSEEIIQKFGVEAGARGFVRACQFVVAKSRQGE